MQRRTHKQGVQRLGAGLAAAMAVPGGVEALAGGQGVVGIKALAGAKAPPASVAQADFHHPLQHDEPLRLAGAVKVAGKAHGAGAPLHELRGGRGAQGGGQAALIQRDAVRAPAGQAVGIGEKFGQKQLGSGVHGRVHGG